MTDREKVKEFFDGYNELLKENERLNYIKGVYHEIAKELLDISEKIKEISLKLDPVITVKSKRNATVDYEEILQDLYAKIQSGTHITKELIESAYPEANAYYIMNKLKDMKDVKFVKDGRNGRLYI